MLTPAELCAAVQVGALAFLALALMQPGMPLGLYSRLLSRLYNTGPEWIAWIAKPMGYCPFCFSWWVGVFGGLAYGATPFEAVLFGAVSVLINSLKS